MSPTEADGLVAGAMNRSLSQSGFIQYASVSRAAVAAGVTAIVIVMATGTLNVTDHASAPIVAISLVVCSVAASADLRTGRLPDALVIAAAIPPIFLALAAAVTEHNLVLATEVVAGAVVFGAPLLVAHLVSPASLGFGDVKLAATLGATLGLVDPRLGVFALCFGAGVTAATALALGHRTVPFGPGLVSGAVVAAGVATQLRGAWT